MRKYNKPEIKVISLYTNGIMDDGFIHQSMGDGTQLSRRSRRSRRSGNDSYDSFEDDFEDDFEDE